jgi:predicted dehydrogenase
MKTNRRSFHRSALFATAAAPVASAAHRPTAAANDQIALGFIGVGNRGCQLLRAFLQHPQARVVAVCDVYEPYLHARYEQVDPRFAALGSRIPRMPELPGEVVRERDFRRLLDRKEIDAVVIATPDHWHAIQTIQSCRAGKDVYVEKPLCVTPREGRAMVDAARRHNRIVQVGTHRRSSAHYKRVSELVAGGALGKVTVARAAYASNMTPGGIGHAEPSAPPAGLDWDLWLGPRPERAFQATIMPYKFRWHHLYSSQMANWGVHYFDLIRWLTGAGEPTAVAALGGRYAVEDDRTIPDTAEVVFEHGSGMLTTFSLHESTGQSVLARGAEVELHGTMGSLHASETFAEIVPERGGQFQDPKPRRKAERIEAARVDLDAKAAGDFLANVSSRTQPLASVEEGHRSTTMALLANLSLATRARIDWDPGAERIVSPESANGLLHYEYRRPWTL